MIAIAEQQFNPPNKRVFNPVSHRMRSRRWQGYFVALSLLAVPAWAGSDAVGLAGKQPDYSQRELNNSFQLSAIRPLAWSPGLNRGYIPQGIAVAGEELLVSAYRRSGDGPKCQIFRIDKTTGETTGELAVVGEYCSHAGGLAYSDDQRLFVSDTRRLYEIQLNGIETVDGEPQGVIHTWELRFPLKGSFAAASREGLWLGVYSKPGPGLMYRIPWSRLNHNKAVLWATDADHLFEITPASQGACLDAAGSLWLSQSTSQYGQIQQLDPDTGQIAREYPVMAGIEDLGCEDNGTLWSVSEAGSQRWSNWEIFYPVVFGIHIDQLKAGND
jgi:hypothetical protein|tara:strand:+ start:331 stop:1317 length:987 start_codon:yes stop_codon:yes gene_type:complete